MAVDIIPLMDHPGWKTMSPVERKKALDLWEAPETTENDRAEMRQVMDSWASSAAQEPSGPGKVVRSVGEMAKAIPPLAYDLLVEPVNRMGGYDPTSTAPPAQRPQTPQEWEARTLPLQQDLQTASGAVGMMANPLAGRAGYMAGQGAQRLAAPWIGDTAASALPAVGEAAAGYGMRQANVAMGNEQPGVVGDIASAAVPLAWRGATSAPVLKRAPGSAAAQHEMAARDVRAGVEGMQPGTPADPLYRAVAQHQNPAIDINDLRHTARALIRQHTARGPMTRDTRVLALAQELDDLGTHYGNQVPLNVLYDRMKAVGELVEESQSKGGRSAQEFSNLYAGFHGVLERASQSNVPGADTLQQAIKASRQEYAVKRLEQITGEGRGISMQQGTGYTMVSGKRMLNEFNRVLADDDVFRGSFTADELAEMRQVFEGANRVPALPVPGSADSGSKRFLRNTTVGASLGGLVAGPPGAAVGGATVALAPEVISRLLMTGPGRQMLRAAFDGRDIIRPETLAVLNQAARQLAEPYISKRPE